MNDSKFLCFLQILKINMTQNLIYSQFLLKVVENKNCLCLIPQRV